MNYFYQFIKRIVNLSFFFLNRTATKKKLVGVAAVMLLVASCGSRQSNPEMLEPSTTFSVFPENESFQENDSLNIKGTLICAHCYALNQENTGVDHTLPESGLVLECASQCADLGYPIAVLSGQEVAGTKVWVIRTSSQLFSDYMGKITELKGSLVTTGIIEPTGILVTTAPGKKQILL